VYHHRHKSRVWEKTYTDKKKRDAKTITVRAKTRRCGGHTRELGEGIGTQLVRCPEGTGKPFKIGGIRLGGVSRPSLIESQFQGRENELVPGGKGKRPGFKKQSGPTRTCRGKGDTGFEGGGNKKASYHQRSMVCNKEEIISKKKMKAITVFP